MTKQQAIELEKEVDELFSDELNEKCTVSMALTKALRVQIGKNFINVRVDKEKVVWVHWIGDFNDLRHYIDHILITIQNNREKIEFFLKSCEMELED